MRNESKIRTDAAMAYIAGKLPQQQADDLAEVLAELANARMLFPTLARLQAAAEATPPASSMTAFARAVASLMGCDASHVRDLLRRHGIAAKIEAPAISAASAAARARRLGKPPAPVSPVSVPADSASDDRWSAEAASVRSSSGLPECLPARGTVEVIAAVARVWKVTADTITGRSTATTARLPRQAAVLLMREAGVTWTAIGAALGRNDNTCWSISKVAVRSVRDATFARRLARARLGVVNG